MAEACLLRTELRVLAPFSIHRRVGRVGWVIGIVLKTLLYELFFLSLTGLQGWKDWSSFQLSPLMFKGNIFGLENINE